MSTQPNEQALAAGSPESGGRFCPSLCTHEYLGLRMERTRGFRYQPCGYERIPCLVLSRKTELNGANQPVEWVKIRRCDGRTQTVAASDVLTREAVNPAVAELVKALGKCFLLLNSPDAQLLRFSMDDHGNTVGEQAEWWHAINATIAAVYQATGERWDTPAGRALLAKYEAKGGV